MASTRRNIISSYWRRALRMLPTTDKLWRILFEPRDSYIIATILLLIELCLSIAVVNFRAYTEIDWIAYMQEVEGVVNGTFDYAKLGGHTGPLVYPAGFVYIYMAFYWVTNFGVNIRLAQYIFVFLYILNLSLVFNIYCKCAIVPGLVLAMMSLTSYRIHSIFMLRLFNDPVAMIFLYGAINFLIHDKWFYACTLFSLAVSVKMNILLFAPAFGLLLLATRGMRTTLLLIFHCGVIQLVLALPFLLTAPFSYFNGAFNFGRVFIYKWTVNLKFLPEELFVDKRVHLALLLCHFVVLFLFVIKRWTPPFGGLYKFISSSLSSVKYPLTSQGSVLLLFTCNFIGMCFSRSLHYQFYIWYYHTLPFLLWFSKISNTKRLLTWGLIELCWNTYPSTWESSLMLQLCHFWLLYQVWCIRLVSADDINVSSSASGKEK